MLDDFRSPLGRPGLDFLEFAATSLTVGLLLLLLLFQPCWTVLVEVREPSVGSAGSIDTGR